MSVTSNNPLWLAPMADITAWPVRKMCFHLGVGLAHTEMISAKAVVDKNQSVFPSLFRHPNEGPLVLQLFSGNVDFLLEAAEEALKVSSFEALGINMACPSKKVMASGGGAAMISVSYTHLDVYKRQAGIVLTIFGSLPVVGLFSNLIAIPVFALLFFVVLLSTPLVILPFGLGTLAVSYTHLDVYKRQLLRCYLMI